MRIIESIVAAAGRVPKGYASIGDDVAVVPVRGRKLILKVDMLVESTDVPPGMNYRQAARKAVAMCVSDFSAKGVRPDSFMVSLGLRKGTTQDKVEQLGRGFRDAENEWGVQMVGGDTNEAGELVIDCVMAGFATKVVARNGARPGDSLVVTGPFGYPSAGLKILIEGARANVKFRARATDSVMNPTPNLWVGLALAEYLSSGMDSSDGLARSIHALAKASRVGFEVQTLPEGAGVSGFAKANGLSPEKLVLAGGEEYVIVGTVKQARLASAAGAARRAGGELMTIGKATSKEGQVVLRSGKSTRQIEDEGWTHLG